ncbi:putative pyridoxine kinase [Phaeomoniella chlamydospora]|uniref:pyridoxal kinase n=1 Tax=Phaeomoniella chlamydospora TaxID=158046 RepID=A0A0G2DUH2_PHACM|nr:putative pyridoxine kinase [Phaeomoniella chlamydospora]
MATFVMQAMGCDVAALNTVQFSNHTGYKQIKGTRFPAEHIRELYVGLQQSYLTDFDALLSGYAPSAEVVEAVGEIGQDLKKRAEGKPGSFFWVLDPVMGDQGRLYVKEDTVPAFKKIIGHADLILPNQFEAEILSGIKIDSLSTLTKAITHLHRTHSIPHILITSIRLPDTPTSTRPVLTVIGSTSKTDSTPRLFKIVIPALDCFFSGTGDLFAALMLVRLREASAQARLLETQSWMPDDKIPGPDLPLAKAAEKVLASMHVVLEKTMISRREEMRRKGYDDEKSHLAPGKDVDITQGEGKKWYLAETKAAEVKLVRNVRDLWEPEMRFKAEGVEI